MKQPYSSGEAVAVGRVAVLASPIAMAVPVRRIATFHPNSLRSLVWALPTLRALREGFPGARICSWVRPPLVPLLEAFPSVDEAHPRPRGDLSAQATLMARLHANHFDIAISFSQGANALLLAWATGAPTRAGWVPCGMEALLSHRVEKEGAGGVEAGLELARAVGCSARESDANGLLRIPPGAYERADELLEAGQISGPFVLIGHETGARASQAPTSWPDAVREMARSWPLVLCGERPAPPLLLPLLSAHAPGRHAVADAGGRADVLTLAALCARARGFAGSDSGLLHLAALMDKPCVALCPPNDPPPRKVPYRKLSPDTSASGIAQNARELFGL